ncbi:MAG: polysaccharide pyruvyl transferase family protein [Thermoguttaceae bacterium]|jgi:pyruvyl transferase EpsO
MPQPLPQLNSGHLAVMDAQQTDRRSPLFFREVGVEPPPRPSRALLDAFWQGLQSVLEAAIARKIPRGSTIALLDYQVHGNTGDQLIMLGTERWAAKHGLRTLGRWHADNFRFPRFPPETILVCYGGGNFGDLYRYQRHREKIIQAYPEHRIVILPQTIYFHDPKRLRESAEKMRRHSDLHIFVRDRRSLEVAQIEFPTCSPGLVPDMATFLYPLDEQLGCFLSPAVRHEFVCLCRRDKERTDLGSYPGLKHARCIEWDDITPAHRYFILGVIAFVFLFGKVYPARHAADWWHAFCRRRAIRAAREFASAGCVVSNRLHGHILACLLGVPNLLFDNSYGKCSDYFRAWHADLPFTRLVEARNSAFQTLSGNGDRRP